MTANAAFQNALEMQSGLMRTNADHPAMTILDPSPLCNGMRELFTRAQGHPEALGALMALATGLRLALADRGPVQTVARRQRQPASNDLAETIAFEVRVHRRDELCRDLHRADGDQRRALHAEILRLHTTAERIKIRRSLLSLYRTRYANGLSVSAASKMILKELDRRASTRPRSTGDAERDQILDKIWCCGSKIADRTIRSELN